MTGTVTQTDVGFKVEKLTFDWLSDASGDATATSDGKFTGTLAAVQFVPDTGGTAPSDLYDVTLTDTGGVDLLCGQGANLSSTNTIVVTTNLLPIGKDAITLTIANAGNAKGGIVYVWVVAV